MVLNLNPVQHPIVLSPAHTRSGRPLPGEFAAYAAADIAQVAGDDALAALASQAERVLALLASVNDEAVEGVAYAPDKWTLKDVVAHLADDERVFGYRMLCLARRDTQLLDGFDEKRYATEASATRRSWASLLADYSAVRNATLTFWTGFRPKRGRIAGSSTATRLRSAGWRFTSPGTSSATSARSKRCTGRGSIVRPSS